MYGGGWIGRAGEECAWCRVGTVCGGEGGEVCYGCDLNITKNYYTFEHYSRINGIFC